jgi:5S rRNA maturation endonuclease (ribonuclease M5)
LSSEFDKIYLHPLGIFEGENIENKLKETFSKGKIKISKENLEKISKEIYSIQFENIIKNREKSFLLKLGLY